MANLLRIVVEAGNHDGYASTGHVPAAIDNMLGKLVDWTTGTENGTLFGTINEASPKEWPNFDINAYKAYLDATKDKQGGKHVDLHSGAHRRLAGVNPDCGSGCFKSGWLEVARNKRNYVLYDGVYQWQRTYGPTYASWSFGKTKFVNLNTYELRQHRRTGWGMYTVNYGGGMSQVQVEWTKKELDGADAAGQDVVVIGHHDARGGHNGKDYPYYFKPLEYRGMDQSAANYVKGEILNPKICDLVPEWAQTKDTVLTCLHDGLQEWMRAESEFDCTDKNRFRDARGSVDGICDEASYSGATHPWYSGYEMMDIVMLHPSVRTMILGHTHYNSLEVLQSGQKMVPTTITLDAIAQQQHEASENTNPFRAFSLFKDKKIEGAYDPKFVTPGLAKDSTTVNLAQAGHAFANHTIMGQGRELVILRLTSNADLTSQKYIGANKNSKDGDKMYGFATLHVTAKSDGRGYALPQINEVTFYMNEETGRFEAVEKKPIERSKVVKGAQVDAANPFCQMFRGSGAEACK